jgi:hypothetical protein
MRQPPFQGTAPMAPNPEVVDIELGPLAMVSEVALPPLEKQQRAKAKKEAGPKLADLQPVESLPAVENKKVGGQTVVLDSCDMRKRTDASHSPRSTCVDRKPAG